MDNEDLFIKEIFKKDDLISKKADDVFNNFIKNELYGQPKQVEESTSNVQEVTPNKQEENSKVINLDAKRKKLERRQRILSAAACFSVVFLAANAYAATQGYNNIFFIIKNFAQKQEEIIIGKENILTDSDLTISYREIEISDGVSIQINRLVKKNNEAKLYVGLTIYDKPNVIIPSKIVVEDESGNVLADQLLKLNNINGGAVISKEINLNNLKDSTTKLKVKVYETKVLMGDLEIDLENREINVLSCLNKALEKISEVELKKVLSEYVRINCYNDFKILYSSQFDEKEEVYKNLYKLQTAVFMMDGYDYTVSNVNKFLKEFDGEENSGVLNLPEYSCIYYDNSTKRYELEAGDWGIFPLCLNVENISFNNGIYEVTFTYCYQEEGNIVEDLAAFRTTMKFKLNDNYTFTKYCLVDEKSITSTLIKEPKNGLFDVNGSEFNNNDTHIYENNTSVTNNTTKLNSTTTNTAYTNTTAPATNTSVLNVATVNSGETDFIPIENVIENTASPVYNPNNTNITVVNPNTSNIYSVPDYKIEELKKVAARYILMNYFSDTCNVSDLYYPEEYYKNEMKIYTAFKLDFDGMVEKGFSSTEVVSIDKSIIHEIIEAYTGVDFFENTNRSEIIMEDEGSFYTYIMKTPHTLCANILNVEDVYRDEYGAYGITFTYSYNTVPEKKFRATIHLTDTNPYGLASMFVKYILLESNIVSEKIN